jgi:hypothetical protein
MSRATVLYAGAVVPWRLELEAEENGRKTVVLLLAPIDQAAAGKYVVGLSQADPSITAIAWDPEASFHAHIAARVNVQPRGGGRLELDPARRTIVLAGHSQAFGREPDREWTRRTLERALPGWGVLVEE